MVREVIGSALRISPFGLSFFGESGGYKEYLLGCTLISPDGTRVREQVYDTLPAGHRPLPEDMNALIKSMEGRLKKNILEKYPGIV